MPSISYLPLFGLLSVGCIRAGTSPASAGQSISTSCSEILFRDNGDASPTVLCREGDVVRWNELGEKEADRAQIPTESKLLYDLDRRVWLVGRDSGALPDGPWRKAVATDPDWYREGPKVRSLVWWPEGMEPLKPDERSEPNQGLLVGSEHVLEHSGTDQIVLREGERKVGVLVSAWARRGASISCADEGVWVRARDSNLNQVPPGYEATKPFQYVGDELVDVLYWLNIDESGAGLTATRYPPPGVADQYHTGFRCVGSCVDYVRASHGPDRMAELVSVCSDGRKSARVLDWKPTQDIFLGGSALVIDPHFGYCFAYGTVEGQTEHLACGWPIE